MTRLDRLPADVSCGPGDIDGRYPLAMETLLQILGLALSLLVLWLGLKKIELDRSWKAVMGVLDAGLLIASVIALGWLGFVIAGIATVLGVLGWSVWLAAKKESLLTSAAIQVGSTKQDMQTLHSELYASHRVFKQLGPIGLADLIRMIAERARQPDEIRAMALPIAMLSVTQECDLAWLVEHFDRLLRLYGKPAGEAMAVADMLTVATQNAAATFTEMVDGMCKVVEADNYLEPGREGADPSTQLSMSHIVETDREAEM